MCGHVLTHIIHTYIRNLVVVYHFGLKMGQALCFVEKMQHRQ